MATALRPRASASAMISRYGSQALAAGATIVQEPSDQFWGVRDYAVRDPAGNLVRIEQPPAG